MVVNANRILNNLLAGIAKTGLIISGISIFFMSVVIGLGAISRYLFNKPFGWMEEFAGGLLLPVFFMGLAYVLRIDRHIKMTLIIDRLPQRVKDFLVLFNSLLGLLFGIWLTYEGMRLAFQMLHYKTMYVLLPVSKVASEIFIPVGTAMFSVVCISILISQIKIMFSKKSEVRALKRNQQ